MKVCDGGIPSLQMYTFMYVKFSCTTHVYK